MSHVEKTQKNGFWESLPPLYRIRPLCSYCNRLRKVPLESISEHFWTTNSDFLLRLPCGNLPHIYANWPVAVHQDNPYRFEMGCYRRKYEERYRENMLKLHRQLSWRLGRCSVVYWFKNWPLRLAASRRWRQRWLRRLIWIQTSGTSHLDRRIKSDKPSTFYYFARMHSRSIRFNTKNNRSQVSIL